VLGSSFAAVKRRIGLILSALSVAGICFFTLRTGGTELANGWSWYLTSGDAALAELIQNLILFIPLGASLAAAFPRRPYHVVAFGTALSFCVEFAQQWIPGRDPSVGDIVCNSISTALGVLLVVAAPLWLFALPRRSAWQALATAILAVSAWFVTGAMVQHETPPQPYHLVLTPDFDFFGHYDGTVLKVTPGLGSVEVTAIAAPYPPDRTSPLWAIVDRAGHKIIMLSVDGRDLTLRYYMPALRWTLEQPDLRLRDALKDIAPRDTFTAATWHDSTNTCMRVNTIERCHLGYTIGDGWKLIYYPEQRPAWMLGVLNTLWMAGTVVGVGFWAARGRRGEATPEGATRPRGLAIALVIAGLLMVPLITGLNPTPVHEWIGALGGLIGGYFIGNRTRRQGAGTIFHTEPPS
jgi:hypothetical protein